MAVIWTVEDEERIGILIEDIIASMGHESRRFEDVDSLDKARKQHETPDLLLLDLMLRGKSGFDVLQRWKLELDTRRVPVIILSARSTEADKVRGLDLGAEDYITKPFSIRELKSRINAALRRVTPAATKLQLGSLVLEPDNRGVTYQNRPISLTQQEFELLHHMAMHPGQLLTRGQLLRDVWGYESDTDASRTVDYHIRSLRRKLGDNAANPLLIETVHGSGYRLLGSA